MGAPQGLFGNPFGGYGGNAVNPQFGATGQFGGQGQYGNLGGGFGGLAGQQGVGQGIGNQGTDQQIGAALSVLANQVTHQSAQQSIAGQQVGSVRNHPAHPPLATGHPHL